MNCPNCNAEIKTGSSFCPSCGVNIAEAQAAAVSAVAANTPPQDAMEPASYGAPVVPVATAYQQQGYGQAQNEYQQAGYQQQPAGTQKMYAETTGTSRALAMSTYWGLLPLIFAYAVGDKDSDPFIRTHVNNALVLFIGGVISSFLMILIIGFLLLIFLFVMTIMGTVRAYNGEITPLPLIGNIKILK